MSVVVRAVRPDEYGQCLALWQACFGHISDPVFARFVQAPSAARFLLGGFIASRLVSTVQVIPRCLQTPPTTVRSGYVTNVCSHPDFRRQGLATQCLRHALEVMQAEGLQITRLIATGPAPYAKLGWQASPLPLLQGVIPEHLPTLSPGYHVRPATPEELPQIAALYTAYNQERPLTVQRPLAYWQQWLCTPQPGYLCPTLVCLDGTHLVGYAQVFHHSVWGHLLAEIAARDNDPQILTALLAHSALWVRQSSSTRRLRLAVPVEAPIVMAVQAVLADVQCWATLPWMYRDLQGLGARGDFARTPHNGHAAHTWWFDGM